MHIKKWSGIIAIIIVILVLGYTTFLQFTSSRNTKSLRVGALIPLTGKFAHYGEDIKNSLELGKKYLQDTQGISLSIKYEDSAADPKIALPAAVKLIEIEKVAFVIGGPGSSANLAAAPLFEKHEVPFLPVSNAPGLNGAGEYIFRMLSSIYPELDRILQELQLAQVKSLAIIYDSASDTQTLGKEYLEKKFTQSGGAIALSEGYDSKSTADFRTILAKIKDARPDALYVFSVDKDAGTISRQARELGMSLPIYGWEAQNTVEFFRAAGNFSEDVTITDVPFSCKNNYSEQTRVYCSDYMHAYSGREPLMFGARAYDTLLIGVNQYLQSKQNKTAQFIEHMARVRNYKGISGTLDIDADGNVEDKIFVIRKARNGIFVEK